MLSPDLRADGKVRNLGIDAPAICCDEFMLLRTHLSGCRVTRLLFYKNGWPQGFAWQNIHVEWMFPEDPQHQT